MPSPAGSTASTQSIIGWGTNLEYSTDGETYHALAQVEDVTIPEIEVTKVDKTSLLSPNGVREKRAGLVDPGEATFKLIFLAADVATVYGLVGTTVYWRVTLTDGTSSGSTYVWQGFVSSIGSEIPLDDNVMIPVKIAATGPLTFTAGT